jgi:antitoxin VapB
VAKIDQLARTTGLTRTAAVEQAVDLLLAQQQAADDAKVWTRLDAILTQIDRLPDRAQPVDALDWDEHGLPR